MNKLTEFINGFDIKKDKEPVSFSFHCIVGSIISNNESSINSTTVNEKTVVSQDLISFIP
jgi:hypothetical protein